MRSIRVYSCDILRVKVKPIGNTYNPLEPLSQWHRHTYLLDVAHKYICELVERPA